MERLILIKCGFKKKKKAYIDEFKYKLRLMAEHFAEEIAKQFKESSISEEKKKIWFEGSTEDILHSYVKIEKIECNGLKYYDHSVDALHYFSFLPAEEEVKVTK